MSEGAPSSGPLRAGLSGGVLTAIFVVIVAIGAGVAWLQRGPEVAEVGRKAPDFRFETFSGESFDLGRHLAEGGGPVLLNLWASWCEPCKREFPALSAYADAHPDVTVLGVAVQDQFDAAREFAREMQPGFRVGWDEGGTVRDAYPAFGLPATFLIGADGTVVDIVLAELTPERLDGLDFARSHGDGAT